MEVYVNGERIDVWDVISELDTSESIEVLNHLKSTIGERDSFGSITGMEFEKACSKLIKHRDMLPRDIEDQIISLAKKYTLYH